jgi:DNA repair protein RecO
MAYSTYTTDAIIISMRDRMGSDRMVRLLTEELGMLDARASSVREEKSKMRYALQPFSIARVTLVRGKREWRLTGAECDTNVYFKAHTRSARGALLKLAKLIERLVVGEEPNGVLYRTAHDGFVHLAEDGSDGAFLVVAFRLLVALGYIAPDASLTSIRDAQTTRAALRYLDPTLARTIDERVAHAIAVSQL